MGVEIKNLQTEPPEQEKVEIVALRPGFNYFPLPDPIGRNKEIGEGRIFRNTYETTLPTTQEIVEGLEADTLRKAKEEIEKLGGVFVGVRSLRVVNEETVDFDHISTTKSFVIAWKD